MRSSAKNRFPIRRWGAALALLVVASAAAFTAWRGVHPGPQARGPGSSLPRLQPVPPFSWADQEQRLVTNQTLLGRVWIGDFIFTRCTTVCPLLTGQMTLLRRSIEHPGVTFVSFSVDPGHDTPAVLKEYAARWGGAENWLLLQSAGGSIADFARAMGTPVRQVEDVQNPIIHSDKFFLVDPNGWVRGMYDSNDPAAVQQLIAAAGALADETGGVPAPAREPVTAAAPGDDAVQGMALYHALGCAGCHANRKVAPPLEGIAQRHARADGGLSPQDAEHIRRSILEPDAEIAPGYATRMPSYAGQVTGAEVGRLVAYLATLAAPGGAEASAAVAQHAAAAAAPARVTDPVCKMTVAASPENTPVDHRGTSYYFCSEYCRQQFQSAPQAYLKAQ